MQLRERWEKVEVAYRLIRNTMFNVIKSLLILTWRLQIDCHRGQRWAVLCWGGRGDGRVCTGQCSGSRSLSGSPRTAKAVAASEATADQGAARAPWSVPAGNGLAPSNCVRSASEREQDWLFPPPFHWYHLVVWKPVIFMNHEAWSRDLMFGLPASPLTNRVVIVITVYCVYYMKQYRDQTIFPLILLFYSSLSSTCYRTENQQQ